MPDINAAVDFAIAQSGRPYHAYGARFGPDYFDCSGLVVTALRHAGVDVPAGVGNTVGIYNWAKRIGGLVSVDKAARTKGALLIKGRDYGYGPIGHIEFSLGDGREVGAHSSRSGIGIRDSDASRYQDGFIIPGVDYHLVPPVDPKVVAKWVQRDQWRHRCYAKPIKFGDRGPDVAMLVDMLREAHFLRAGVVGNYFGRVLQTGLYKLKLAHPEIGNTNGKSFGGPAADALLKHL